MYNTRLGVWLSNYFNVLETFFTCNCPPHFPLGIVLVRRADDLAVTVAAVVVAAVTAVAMAVAAG